MQVTSPFKYLFLSLVASHVPIVDAYWRMSCDGTLVKGRLDPIISPGKVSGHVHTVLGGNGFAPTMDYSSTQKSTCTSCSIKGDMSNYWTPTLYYKAQNGTFIDVPTNGGTVYYQQRATYPGKALKAFPEGFRMVAGDPFRRSFDGSVPQQAISHVCLNYNGPPPVPEDQPLPPKPCPNGVRSQVYFPSCWDGVNLDSPDHSSHMAYPEHYNGGQCPDSHPNPVISLFYEIIFATDQFQNEWYGNTQPFVYSMGDPTGFGFHGDFVNGWDVDILQNGVDKKTTNDAGCAGDVTCDGIFEYPDHYGNTCTLPPLVDEQISGDLPALPGCNPVTMNPVKGAACSSSSTLGVDTSNIFTDVTKTLDWSYMGCGVDDYFNRALPTQLADSQTMTVETCIKMCKDKGYGIAGLEYASQCFCGNSLPAKAQPTPGVVGKCQRACTGNAKEICGDASALSLYKDCKGGPCQNAQFGLLGDTGSGGSSGSKPSTGGSTGASGSTGSTPSSPPATKPSPTTGSSGSKSSPSLVAKPSPAKTSSPPVSGASSTPSSGSGSSSSSSSTGLPSGWTAKGCYSDKLASRALTGINLAYWGVPITASGCASYCDKKGFAIAGVEFGSQCYCGNKLEGGSSVIDKGKCNMQCAGDAKQTCGGGLALNVMSKSNSMRRREERMGKHAKEHVRRRSSSRHVIDGESF